ncbi:hypothetical protein DIPPA_33790 [Diplonema papillatum]|nr:hypothetical protein DIPPA_33790 [Diplonema papillatum]
MGSCGSRSKPVQQRPVGDDHTICRKHRKTMLMLEAARSGLGWTAEDSELAESLRRIAQAQRREAAAWDRGLEGDATGISRSIRRGGTA